MDSARSWFHKLQPREKLRGSAKKKEDSSEDKSDEFANSQMDDEALSTEWP